MALSAIPPRTSFFADDFLDQCRDELMKFAPYCLDVAVVVGHPHPRRTHPVQRGSLLRGARLEAMYFKQELPNYQVFDEKRYFSTGNRPCVFDVEGRKIGLTICEDLWFPAPAAQAKAAGAEILISINASPFNRNKLAERYQVMGARVKETASPLVYDALDRRARRAGLRRRVLRVECKGRVVLPGRNRCGIDRYRRSRWRQAIGPDRAADHRGGNGPIARS
jgi:predicted amidohydrolase